MVKSEFTRQSEAFNNEVKTQTSAMNMEDLFKIATTRVRMNQEGLSTKELQQ